MKLPSNPFKKISKFDSFLIVFTSILLIVFCIFLIGNIRTANRSGIFAHRSPISQILLRDKQASRISTKDVELIDVWMTFRYINFLFNIPESYLKDTLHIKDTRYPNISLSRFVKNEKLDRIVFIEKIKNIVRRYLSAHPLK